MILWLFLPLILQINNVRSVENPKCAKLDISLTQKVENDGFHRELRWLLERNPEPDCQLVIRFYVPPEIYVNPDQIADLSRTGQLPVYVDGIVDVEAPAHEAKGHIVYVFVPSLEKVSVDLPFHLRYQRARISGGFSKIVIYKPSVLAMCEEACGASIKAPCDVTGASQCPWKNTTYQALFEDVELLLPVGDLNDYPLVSIVTLLLGCAGCIYTLSILSTAPL